MATNFPGQQSVKFIRRHAVRYEQVHVRCNICEIGEMVNVGEAGLGGVDWRHRCSNCNKEAYLNGVYPQIEAQVSARHCGWEEKKADDRDGE